MRDTIKRDLLLAHAFEQCGLHARRCAVDLIGQYAVSEDRTGDELEVALIDPVERIAQQVSRQ